MEGGDLVDPLQEGDISRMKRPPVEGAESTTPGERDQSRKKRDQIMKKRVYEKRRGSPTLSMKSDSSMCEPMSFKGVYVDLPQENTETCFVQLNRSGSVKSMDHPLVVFRHGERSGLCDTCTAFHIEKRAVKTCQNCSSSYCENHVRNHYTEARFKTHRLVDVGELTAPGHLVINSYSATSVRLSWDGPTRGEGIKQHFSIRWQSIKDNGSSVTKKHTKTLSGLQSNTKYTISVSTFDKSNQLESVNACMDFKTKLSLDSYIRKLGLSLHAQDKLSMNTMLHIDGQMLKDDLVTHQQLLSFLRELFMLNVSARGLKYINPKEVESMMMNPLDLITATFLCSDGLLQQQIALKMSMCQFAVPLLLPNHETEESTLMRWALKDIVKSFKPHSLEDKNASVEKSIVLAELPMVSFIRLNKSSLSKSRLLNEVVSNSQQSYNTFVHYNMTGGNIPRQISDGLVEISWYLPCGNKKIDIFREPVAVANLRGDIQDFQTQFHFLCETSAAVFLFCDDFNRKAMKQIKTPLYIVCNSQAQSYNATSFQSIQKYGVHMIERRTNDADLVQDLRSSIQDVISTGRSKIPIDEMFVVAKRLKMMVDEDHHSCQNGKKKADEITGSVCDISNFKDNHLPLQGKILENLAKIEREECKLLELGGVNIETYKSELGQRRAVLRKEQGNHGMKDNMSRFINALKNSKERLFFLKWMKINLDNLTRTHLSDLRGKYKEEGKEGKKKEKLKDLENQICRSSIGNVHFLREMGQLYEASKSSEAHQSLKDLPVICATLILDGHPLELIDGDASTIPVRWITDVLTEIHSQTKSNSRIRVVTILGVQSSGKSTLLNTMFGVQFAVSSGRCTRGAFMQLIRVEENLKEQLDCDFLMIIDTEGLKAPELAQLADSYRHDNELATLVVGLSDITIINITAENSTEMKDTVHIVVHAFLRMKEVGKKHMCQFVHQNVADVAAHDNNATDRKLLLQQLNEMTEVAARMEKKENNKEFTDIMVYDPDKDTCYLPGLWYGNPPMAPVNAGYSEAVNELKKTIIQRLINLKTPVYSMLDFLEWTKALWNAVKHENFIFSFRNSLEADAYNMLSVEFSKLDVNFRHNIQQWWQKMVTAISNCQTSDLMALNTRLKKEGTSKLEREASQMLKSLDKYYKKKAIHAEYIERHKQSFVNSVKLVREETENSMFHKLEMVITSKRGMEEIENLKEKHSSTMEEQVIKLLQNCRDEKMTDAQLEQKFEDTWKTTVESLQIKGLDTQDVDADVLNQLWKNMKNKGVNEILNKISRLDICQTSRFQVPKKKTGAIQEAFHFFQKKEQSEKQKMALQIIRECKRLIANTVKIVSDYQSMHAIDVLDVSDKMLQKNQHLVDARFEASLKIHICAHASREFQEMHKAFLEANDPQRCLEKFKPKYLADFKDLFKDADQSERKAEDFTKLCLEPAVRDYIQTSLGPDIVRTMTHRDPTLNQGIDFTSRMFFQYSILNQLLSNDTFVQILMCVTDYNRFVEELINKTVEDGLSKKKNSITDLEIKNLDHITEKIEHVMESVLNDLPLKEEQTKSESNVSSFINNICHGLNEDLVIPKEGLRSVLHLNQARTKPFYGRLKVCVREMKQTLSEEFVKDKNIKAKLKSLHYKPQDELLDRMIGCGHQCPFCLAPCEAEGTGHEEHFTTIHRSPGLGGDHDEYTYKLVVDICSSLVSSENMFMDYGKEEPHPYKDYRSVYPDWRIQPDPSIETSDYWKYVFAKYNQQFADTYKQLNRISYRPADIPPGWYDITKGQARESLLKSYRLNAHETKVADSPK